MILVLDCDEFGSVLSIIIILSRAGQNQKFVDFGSDQKKKFKYKKQQTRNLSVIQMELNPLLEHYVNSITM